MISVILPTYNGERYLREAMESILNQTYAEIELIVVDDCSTDRTLEIVQDIAQKDARVKIYHNDRNLKLPRSLNEGFSKATGEYFTWTSDDNIYKKDALQKMLRVMQEDPAVDIVYALFDIIDSQGNIKGAVTKEQCAISNIYGNNPVGACFLYKRQVHEKLNGYNPDCFLVEDYDFWLRAQRYFHFQLIEESLYSYRVHGGSLTEKHKAAIEKATAERIEEELEQIKERDARVMLGYERLLYYYYRVFCREKLKKYLMLIKSCSGRACGNCEVPVYIKVSAVAGKTMGRTVEIIGRIKNKITAKKSRKGRRKNNEEPAE